MVRDCCSSVSGFLTSLETICRMTNYTNVIVCQSCTTGTGYGATQKTMMQTQDPREVLYSYRHAQSQDKQLLPALFHNHTCSSQQMRVHSRHSDRKGIHSLLCLLMVVGLIGVVFTCCCLSGLSAAVVVAGGRGGHGLLSF